MNKGKLFFYIIGGLVIILSKNFVWEIVGISALIMAGQLNNKKEIRRIK